MWLGIESKWARYKKLQDLDAATIIAALKRAGIIPLTSMFLGYDWHDEKTIEEDFQYLLSLKPAFAQAMLYSPCPQTPLYRRILNENRRLDVPYKFYDGFHALFKHPHLSPERLEFLLEQFFQREYEELGPSICRVLEVQLMGFQSLHDNSNRLFRARAREHKNLCLEIYPLLQTAIRQAPSHKVHEYLIELKERVETEFRIPALTKAVQTIVPALAFYTRCKDYWMPNPQPRPIINRYRFS